MEIPRSFYRNWSKRFSNNRDKFITPNNLRVKDEAEKADLTPYDDDINRAFRLWDYSNRNYRYSLSKKWKTPQETIIDKVGDCEDFTFLLASMFPHGDIEESRIVLGEIVAVMEDGKRKDFKGDVSAHTWNEVDGNIIDATTTPEQVNKFVYKEYEHFTIRSVYNDN